MAANAEMKIKLCIEKEERSRLEFWKAEKIIYLARKNFVSKGKRDRKKKSPM